jgi:hypothetical protein
VLSSDANKTVVSAGGLRINTTSEVLTKKRKYYKVQDSDIYQMKIITHGKAELYLPSPFVLPNPRIVVYTYHTNTLPWTYPHICVPSILKIIIYVVID